MELHASGPAVPGPEVERDLVARARARDAEAFRRLVELHQDRAYALALRLVRIAGDAEEVAQDAFVRAWLALPRFRGESSFATWLHRIVARRAFDRLAQLRVRSGREVVLEEAALPAAPGEDPAARATARRLERLMQGLSPVQRGVVTLFYYEDHSVDQVARALGLPENTVKTHLARARAALREAWLREEGRSSDELRRL
jgi:RNA polymerase sigma-70 factor (ECF subfamily)